jgi:hypothetical protein
MHKTINLFGIVALVPKLQLGNSVREALASRLAKLELRYLGSQAGAWEPAKGEGLILHPNLFAFCLSPLA